MSRRLESRLKKIEKKKLKPFLHFIYMRPGETKEEAVEIYQKGRQKYNKRQIFPGDRAFYWGNMPIPDWYKEYYK